MVGRRAATSNLLETIRLPSRTHPSPVALGGISDVGTLNSILGFWPMLISRRSVFVHGRKAVTDKRVESKVIRFWKLKLNSWLTLTNLFSRRCHDEQGGNLMERPEYVHTDILNQLKAAYSDLETMSPE